MKKIIAGAAFFALIVSCKNGGTGKAQVTNKLETQDQKAAYAYGMNIGEQVMQYSQSQKEDSLNFDEIRKGFMDYINYDKKNRESYANGLSIGLSMQNFIKGQKLEGKIDEKLVLQGLMDVLNKDSLLFSKDSINSFMNKYIQAKRVELKDENTKKGKEFIENKKKESKVKSTESGLLYEVVQEGNGSQPNDNSIVEVNYEGKLIDGNSFDKSEKGNPVKFPLKNVIKGWQEGLKLMKAGSKYKFYIPGELAYGEFGSPDGKIGPNETLVFDVELVSVEAAPAQETPQRAQTPTVQKTIPVKKGN